MRSAPTRILTPHLDGSGNIALVVTIGDGRGIPPRELAVSARPLTVARWLREVADDVERLA